MRTDDNNRTARINASIFHLCPIGFSLYFCRNFTLRKLKDQATHDRNVLLSSQKYPVVMDV
ncbi:hypothetical protein DXA14_24310 [Hungatella hathewayi]|nr:hypothetical protein DXA14_24310 [Hungatella hathewayi]